MPKKPVRNAFYFYMKELEPSLRREGRVFPNGIADVVPLAHPRWKALSEHEKERFENMSKEYKAKMRGVKGDHYKMDNVGNIISKRVNTTELNDKRRQRERREVIAKWTGKNITEETFYFINFQILCKTENGDYLPCELAIIEYSLSRGIQKKFHRFIEPGQIPTGYRYVCMNNSEETHQIPIENFEKSDSNYTGISIQIENFINPNGDLPEYPPFYCASQSHDMIEYCLEWLHNRSRMGHVSRIKKVYCLEDLLMDLYVHGNGPKISQSGCLDVLTSHHWDYSSNTRCDFHEELECKHCSLAIVQRAAFAFSDALAVIFEFKLTEKHLPSTAEEDLPCVILPSQPISQNNRRYFNQQRNQNYEQRGRGQRIEGIGRPGQHCVVDDDEDDLDSNCDNETPKQTNLRRPNESSMALSGNAWNTIGNSNSNSNPTMSTVWPSLSGTSPVKYAGGAAAPDASSAPAPPISWQISNGSVVSSNDEIFGQTKIPLQIEPSVGVSNEASKVPPAMLRGGMIRSSGPQTVSPQNPLFAMRGVQFPGHMPTSLGMAGRGSNIRMGGLVRPSVGRGYAPPGMLKMQKQMNNTSLND